MNEIRATGGTETDAPITGDCAPQRIGQKVGEATIYYHVSGEALNPALQPPGRGLLRTLEGHAGWVNAVAVTPDGRRAVSASRGDKTPVGGVGALG